MNGRFQQLTAASVRPAAPDDGTEYKEVGAAPGPTAPTSSHSYTHTCLWATLTVLSLMFSCKLTHYFLIFPLVSP